MMKAITRGGSREGTATFKIHPKRFVIFDSTIHMYAMYMLGLIVGICYGIPDQYNQIAYANQHAHTYKRISLIKFTFKTCSKCLIFWHLFIWSWKHNFAELYTGTSAGYIARISGAWCWFVGVYSKEQYPWLWNAVDMYMKFVHVLQNMMVYSLLKLFCQF